MSRRCIHSALAGVALGLLTASVNARPICQWVDANGAMHMSDTVPPQYQSTATCTDSQKYELTDAQQAEADQRAAQAQSLLRKQGQGLPAPHPPPAARPAGAPPPVIEKRPIEAVTDTTDCQTWWRIYDESGACFGPFKTTQGGIKPEAYDHCNEVQSPEMKCGPRRN